MITPTRGAASEAPAQVEASAQVTIGIDVGGSKVYAGLVDAAGVVLAETWAITPDPGEGPGVVEEVLTAAVRELRSDHPGLAVRAVGVGAAGLVDSCRGV
ncbi:MAG: ROK family protein, partial [Nocardioides sp.]|nr:ROK family protein [Nocardioides sp.]